MPKAARRVSLLFDGYQVNRFPQEFGRVLAAHLLGARVSRGDHVALPGWPVALVDEVDPDGAEVRPGTVVEMHIPPPRARGALTLVAVVDASLTMGKGEPSRFEEAASTLDALVLNGRAFIQEVGIVVQGGDTRHADALRPPEDVSGASILKATPKGTFDLEGGLERALEILEAAGDGPRVVLVLTDGRAGLRDPETVAAPVRRTGTIVVACSVEGNGQLAELCRTTGGEAATTPREAFHALAKIAGTRAEWTEPGDVQPARAKPYEFEVVIEAMED